MELDIFIGTMKNALPKYLGKWSGLYNVLRNMWSNNMYYCVKIYKLLQSNKNVPNYI